MSGLYEHISGKLALQGIQVNSKSQFLNSKQIQITEAVKGNTKHKVLNPKQIRSTIDQMTKTFRIYIFVFRVWSQAPLGFSASANDEEFG